MIEIENIKKRIEKRENTISHNEKTNDQIKGLIKEVLYNSLAQAIIKIVLSPHYILKAFLFICVIVSSAIASYLVVKSVLTYFNYGATTTSRTVYETFSVFPKITICNQNRFTSEYSIKILSNISEIEFNMDMLDSSQTSNLSQQEKDSKFSKIDLLATYLINNKTIFSNEQRKNLSHDLEDILLNCSFNNEPCDSSDFVWKFHRVRNFQ